MRFVKKRWFVRSARSYPVEVQHFRFFRLPIAKLRRVQFQTVLIFFVLKFFIFYFSWKKYALQKNVYWVNFVQFWILYSDIFFFGEYSVFQFSDKISIISSDEKRDRRAPNAYLVIARRPSNVERPILRNLKSANVLSYERSSYSIF